MSLSVKQKAIIWITVTIVIIWLGLKTESRVIGGRFVMTRTSTLSLYGCPIGLSQDALYFKIKGPITELRHGLFNLIPIARYKYRFSIATFLVGLLSFMGVKKIEQSG